MKPIIEVQNIAKRYQINHLSAGYLSIRERILDIFRRSGERQEDFWALKDVSFELNPGDSLGIIGRNGAGKSTLLKILSRITPPTRGRILARGRIASLLEVGTGFHPELTGRENVFFNGSLLGMKLREIERKFDEIVDFSGVEKFLDTPLKHYSSGMQLRLAFAVAAFLEPEILVIDEVLAVGDAEFQKKCMGKMNEVSHKEGRTILFVSHNMSAVRTLCSKCILMKSGTIDEAGPTDTVLGKYHAQLETYDFDARQEHKSFILTGFKIYDEGLREIETFNTNDHISFLVSFSCRMTVKDFSLAICFNNMNGVRVTSLWSLFQNQKFNLEEGGHVMRIEVPVFRLIPGVYEVIIYAESEGVMLERIDNFRNIVVGLDQNMIHHPTEAHGAFVEDFNVIME